MTRTAARPRSRGCPGYTLVRERVPQSGEEARRLVRAALATWGLAPRDVDTAELVVAELVANAVRHASGSALRIIVDRPDARHVYVAVVDRAPGRLPELRVPGPDETDGRGLLLVDAVSDRWGWDYMGTGAGGPWGKRVWAKLQVSSR
ncbi:ATP-binding protein [Streptomyces sp. NPDC001118]